MFWSDPETVKILQFMQRMNMDHPDKPTPLSPRLRDQRLNFIREELEELTAADNMVDEVDALIDLVYVVKGYAILLGVGGIWDQLFQQVQTANVSKRPGSSSRLAQDAIKPDNWVGPESGLRRLLESAGAKGEHLL